MVTKEGTLEYIGEVYINEIYVLVIDTDTMTQNKIAKVILLST